MLTNFYLINSDKKSTFLDCLLTCSIVNVVCELLLIIKNIAGFLAQNSASTKYQFGQKSELACSVINTPLIDRFLNLGCCLIYLCLRIQIQLSLSRKRPSTVDMIPRPNEPLESASVAPQRSNGTQLVLSTFFLEIKFLNSENALFTTFWLNWLC